MGSVVVLALSAGDASAGQVPVSLGAADGFAALAGSTVTSTGPTTLNGDLGVSPGSSLTGFPPGKVNGTIHATDPTAAQAQADLTIAYNEAASRQPPQALPADVGGKTLTPGVYKTGATPALGVTGTLTLDGQGDPTAVFVIQVGSALTTAVGSHVNLIGEAQPSNVFWQVGSSATLGTSSTFAGTILAYTSISINSGVTLDGRALARNGAVNLIDDTINVPTAPIPVPLPTGVDTNPTGTAIQTAAHTLAGAAFGGFRHDGNVYYIGFTSNVNGFLAQLQSQFPNVELHGYMTPRGADELDAISSEIEATMLTADPTGQILYAVPNETAGVVDVGVMDPSSALAQQVAVKYGRLCCFRGSVEG